MGARPTQKIRWAKQPLRDAHSQILEIDQMAVSTAITSQHSSVSEVEPSALMKPLLLTWQLLLEPLVSQKGNPVISKQNTQPRFTPSSEKHCIRWNQTTKSTFPVEFCFIFLCMAIKKLMAKDTGSSKNDAYEKILLNLMQHEIIRRVALNTLL